MVAATLLSNRTDSDEAISDRPIDALRFQYSATESSSRLILDEREDVYYLQASAGDWFPHALAVSDHGLQGFETAPDVRIYGWAFEFKQSTTSNQDQKGLRREPPSLAEVERSVRVVQSILASVFDTGAYVVPLVEIDPESGRPENILEAHYCFPDEEDQLSELIGLHEEFIQRYTSETPSSVRGRWILRWVAVDGD